MTQPLCKNKSKKIIVKEYEEIVDDDEGFQIEDVSGWLEQVDSNEAEENELFHNDLADNKTPQRPSQTRQVHLLKSSPHSPLLSQLPKRQREIPLTKPTPPVFKREEVENSQDIIPESSRANSDKKRDASMLLTNDLDLDASVSAIFNLHKRSRIQEKNNNNKEKDKNKNKAVPVMKKVMMECPICSRMFPKEEIELHASDCNGACSDSDEENTSSSLNSQNHGQKKKTMANGIAQSEAIRKRKYKNITQIPINYYLQSEDMVSTDGADFASSSSGLNWESAGQTRFS